MIGALEGTVKTLVDQLPYLIENTTNLRASDSLYLLLNLKTPRYPTDLPCGSLGHEGAVCGQPGPLPQLTGPAAGPVGNTESRSHNTRRCGSCRIHAQEQPLVLDTRHYPDWLYEVSVDQPTDYTVSN